MTQDWHPADVKAALAKKGHTLRSISAAAGLSTTAASKALAGRPWPALKRFIAETLGVPPQAIWPSIFDDQGRTRQVFRTGRKRSTDRRPGHVHSKPVA
jgi:Ner family transcriptional regulator